MLQARGVGLTREKNTAGVAANQLIQALDVSIPADPSSAAFFVALALLADSGELRIMDVCLNPSRAGFMGIVRAMGASLEIENERESGGELVGTIVARPSSLRGATVGAADVPAAIDELPVLACLATRASGETTVAGAAELRVKESDRIATIVGNLRAVGAEAEERPDGFTVRGSERPLRGTVRTAGDHRIAMAFGVLSALPGNAITIDDPACASVSYPEFWRDMERALS
jgi:3-phosphoshikimate 1-carboxyvinyltransferase